MEGAHIHHLQRVFVCIACNCRFGFVAAPLHIFCGFAFHSCVEHMQDIPHHLWCHWGEIMNCSWENCSFEENLCILLIQLWYHVLLLSLTLALHVAFKRCIIHAKRVRFEYTTHLSCILGGHMSCPNLLQKLPEQANLNVTIPNRLPLPCYFV